MSILPPNTHLTPRGRAFMDWLTEFWVALIAAASITVLLFGGAR